MFSIIERRAPSLPSPNKKGVKAGNDLIVDILPALKEDQKPTSPASKYSSTSLVTLEKGWGPRELQANELPTQELEGGWVAGKTLPEISAMDTAPVELRGERKSAVEIEGKTYWAELQ